MAMTGASVLVLRVMRTLGEFLTLSSTGRKQDFAYRSLPKDSTNDLPRMAMGGTAEYYSRDLVASTVRGYHSARRASVVSVGGSHSPMNGFLTAKDLLSSGPKSATAAEVGRRLSRIACPLQRSSDMSDTFLQESDAKGRQADCIH